MHRQSVTMRPAQIRIRQSLGGLILRAQDSVSEGAGCSRLVVQLDLAAHLYIHRSHMVTDLQRYKAQEVNTQAVQVQHKNIDVLAFVRTMHACQVTKWRH